ncbi:capsular biosynthesis protein [Aquabacterium sp. A7-Y]|uniref:capsular biosynthesis protein n=1 Tax=Aquabacterium sp. A7-Y TaxID=1349605 RepID=UPI00223D8557|nr:capsular biosynthesis protein [Aquabacterium sp. A7-Y]MCW7538936.1 capsular biosynthesis protein [Aquabacterium sp. A7-Y]
MTFVQSLTPRRLKIALIAVPLLLATLYYVFFAADRYVSESIVTVRQTNQESSNLPGVALLLGGVNPPSREDTLYLRQYIHSLEMLKRLDAKLNLRAHYEAEKLDPLYRLYGGTSQEWFLEYYRSRVEVLFDEVASLLTVRVQGFEPAFAQQVAQGILQESEQFVNAFSHRIAREQMGFAEQELQRAAERLQAAKAKMVDFQDRHRLLDPAAQAQASGALTAELQATLAKHEAELRHLRSFLNENSYQVQALQSQVEALRKQLEAERGRATSGKSSDRLNALASQFRDLTLQAGFAEDAYKLALSAVENARIDATRKLKSLVVIEPPAKPEIAIYPRRVYDLVTLFVVCCLLYGVTRLVVTTVRDHQD